MLPDGSASNAAPGISRRQGTQTGAKVHYLTIDFDGSGSTIEQCFWGFRLPTDYSSAPTLKLQWQANATVGTVIWQAKVGNVTPADADTVLEHAFSSAATTQVTVNTTEARRLIESSIDLSSTFDSGAAGDRFTLLLYRDPTAGSDTATVDAELLGASFEYTTT